MGRKSNKRQVNKSWAIVVDGETEVWYFQLLKQHEKGKLSDKKIDISPELAQKKSLKNQFEDVKNKVNSGYDKVIWLLDFDTILEEENKRKKGGISVVKAFEKYKRDLEKEGVEVFVNTPCLEFWILLHFEKCGKFYPQCKKAQGEVTRKYLKSYKKTERYFKKYNDDIYKKLKEFQPIAKRNAKALGNYNHENTRTAKAEIFEILDLLLK